MAITAYTGLPGSGKSYGVVKHVILPALEKKRRVWTNIPLASDVLSAEERALVTQFSVSDIQENPDWFLETFEPGATIIIDEVWDLWPAGMKATDLRDDHKNFLAKHRHMVGADGNSTEVVLVTQDLAQIAAYPRGLVETTYRAEKLVQIGRTNNYRIDVYRGPATGPNPPEKNRLRQLFGKYEKTVYQYYQSQTMSEADTHGDESRTDSRTNILSSGWLKFGFPAFTIAVIVFGWWAYTQVGKTYHLDESEEQTAPTVSLQEAVHMAGLEGMRMSSGKPVPAPEPRKENHFYDGMDAYIAWNNGKFPWVDFKIAFTDSDHIVVMRPDELGKLGYAFVAHDPCFAQLIGHGSTLNIFCGRADGSDTGAQPIIDF